jgi:hypothetical protein
LLDGTYVLYATDVAGNLSLVSSNTMVVDSTAPPSISQMLLSADTGTSASDFITQTGAQTISGTLSQAAAAGQKVRLSLDNGSTWTDINLTVGATTWSASNQSLSGSNTIKAKVVAANGLESLLRAQDYTVDTTAPSTLSTLAITPSGGTLVANALNSSNTAMAFSATIGAGQATGGKAEFYVDNLLVGTDASISNTDT